MKVKVHLDTSAVSLFAKLQMFQNKDKSDKLRFDFYIWFDQFYVSVFSHVQSEEINYVVELPRGVLSLNVGVNGS